MRAWWIRAAAAAAVVDARLCATGALHATGYCCPAGCGGSCGSCSTAEAACCPSPASSPWCVAEADVRCYVPPGEPEAANATFPAEVAPSDAARRDPSRYRGVVGGGACSFDVGSEVSVTFALEGGEGSAFTAQPHDARAKGAALGTAARLCEEGGTAAALRGARVPAILSVTDSVAYFLSWWHLAANRAAYARRFALRSFVWFGPLPASLQRTSALCRSSVYGRDQWRRREAASVHYAKVAGALAVLDLPTVAGLLYVDMDALFDPFALRFDGPPDAFSAVARAYPARSVVFAEGNEDRRWRVIGDLFFAREDAWAKAFLADWLSNRCGFKDQYPLWHVILSAARRANCLAYGGEVYESDYWAARDLDLDLDATRCEALPLDNGNVVYGRGLNASAATPDSPACPVTHFAFAHKIKQRTAEAPCARGFVSHLSDNKHHFHVKYRRLDGAGFSTAKLRASRFTATLDDVGLRPGDPLHDAPLAAGCCASRDGASLCDHWPADACAARQQEQVRR